MKSLLQLIHDYHSGVKNAGEEILKRMEPLIKSYASRIHCLYGTGRCHTGIVSDSA